MRIIAVETSCDETALAVLNFLSSEAGTRYEIEREIVASQIEAHRPYGGVVPHIARREHEKNLPIIFDNILRTAFNAGAAEADVVAVTVGPGLDPCLWSGINFAKDIHKKHFPGAKLVGANHLEGHLYSFLLSQEAGITNRKLRILNGKVFPAVQLLVSGGHTMLILMRSLSDWEILGQTRDDSVGETFDKVARMLGLPYPGGPEVEKLARSIVSENGGNSRASCARLPSFPEPMMHSGDYDFSYSGLKTAVLYYLRDHPSADKAAVARAFQEAAFAPLVHKAKKAAERHGAKSVMLSGGVAASRALREKVQKMCRGRYNFFTAPAEYNTDNAVMIALAAYINQLAGKKYKLGAQPDLSL